MAVRKLVDPKCDFAFKKVFGTKKNSDVLIAFLNDMLYFRNAPPIVEVTLQQTIFPAEIYTHKTVILDVLCKDADGHLYIVEMQAIDQEAFFTKRAEFYVSSAYYKQLDKGYEYQNLKEVYFIGVLNFTLFPPRVPMHSIHATMEINVKERCMFGHTYVYLELPKFKKGRNDLHKLTTNQERWAYFFKYAEGMSDEEWEVFMQEDEVFKKIYSSLDQASWSKSEMAYYDLYLKRVRDDLNKQKILLEQAEAKGEAKGEAKLAEAKAEGEAKLAEAKLEMVRNLLALGLDVDKISKVSGLSVAEIADLQKNKKI